MICSKKVLIPLINARLVRWFAVRRLWWQAATCFLILMPPAAGQDAVSQTRAEIKRLQQSLKEKPISIPDIPNANSMIGDALKKADESLGAGWPYLSLEQLAQATDLLQGARTAIDKAEAVKSGLPAFEAEWGKVSLDLAALDQKFRERNWDNTRAAIRALSETAQGKAIPLLEGGRGFATALEPKAGLFYVGQAQGEADFAKFCASLNFPRKGAPYPLRSMLPELQNLQEKTNAAFQPPRSIELHPRFIVLNSTLKLAEELDAAKFYAGALYQYLEAVRHHGLLDAVAPDRAQQDELKRAIAAAGKQLDASERDDSIAQFFVERAESELQHADGSAPSADEWKSAKVIIDQVLPAYFAAQKPPSGLAPQPGKTVDITLVRWPYT